MVKMSTIPEIVPFSETISQTAKEGLGAGGQLVIAKSEIGYFGETRQPGQERLRVGKAVMSGSTSEMSFGATLDCDLKPEHMGPVHSKGRSNDAATQSRKGLDEMLNADTKLQSVVRTATIRDIGQGGNASDLSLEDLTFDELVKMSMDFPASDEIEQCEEWEEWPAERELSTFSTPERYGVYNHISANPRRVRLTSAPSGSKWLTAIERNDCKTLLQLLEVDPKRGLKTALQTDPDGRSVLHIAIMQGCTELVHKLHAIPSRSQDSSAFKILWENAKDDSMLTASALDIWRMMDADSAERSSDDYISAHPMRPPLSDEEEAEISSLRKVMSSHQERFQMDEADVNFNFDVRSELLIHMACSGLRNLVGKKFALKDPSVRDHLSEIVTFISKVLKELKDKKLLQNLFNLKDARGRTILQVFVAYKYPIANENQTWVEDEFRKVLEILPPACVNVCDRVGRTVLHWAVAHHSCWAVKILVESGKADLCKTCKTGHFKDVTALHLAVLYDCDDCARHLLESNRNLNPVSDDCDDCARQLLESNCNFNKMRLSMEIDISFGSYSQKKWRPLDLAIILARVKLARRMRQVEEYEMVYPSKKNCCLHLAAASGDLENLQLFLTKEFVDQLNSSYKNDLETDLEEYPPPLHLAVHGKPPEIAHFDISDFFSPESFWNRKDDIGVEDRREKCYYPYKKPLPIDIERQGCINLLLQAGADIWAKDKMGNWADPGATARPEARLWWYERVAKETDNIRKQLNAAGTGIALVAALVATTSFVGPLQPPLGYVNMPSGPATIDLGVQETQFMIRVFVVSNSLSFYLAIASIMLAIVPSLPIPQDGLLFGVREELQRNRKTVSIALAMLLASIISVLISFAASSLAVVHRQHKGLTLYTTLIGGLACILVSFFFSLRLLRLILTKNILIINLYEKFNRI